MISDIPPNRRCWFTPSAASGITTKVTCSEVRAFADCLFEVVSQLHLPLVGLKELFYLHPYPNIHIAAWDFRRSKEGMPAVTPGTGDFDGVASAVRFCRIERDSTALIAVRGVGRPGRLVPAALEVARYLGE